MEKALLSNVTVPEESPLILKTPLPITKELQAVAKKFKNNKVVIYSPLENSQVLSLSSLMHPARPVHSSHSKIMLRCINKSSELFEIT